MGFISLIDEIQFMLISSRQRRFAMKRGRQLQFIHVFANCLLRPLPASFTTSSTPIKCILYYSVPNPTPKTNPQIHYNVR